MRIAVIGAGGVGGYFGARLAAGGHDLVLVARGDHGQAIADNGLRVESSGGDVTVRPIWVGADPSDAGFVDVVTIAVKLFDLEDAARLARPLIGPGTIVLPVQNGVEAAEIVAGVLPDARVASGIAYIGAAIARPGVVRHATPFARLVYGAREPGLRADLAPFHAACTGAGIDATLTDAIDVELWQKFALLAPMAGSTAFFRRSIGGVLEHPDGEALVDGLLRETIAVGRAHGIDLPDDIEAATRERLRVAPYDMRTSMQHDLENGRRLELEWLTGLVVRLGERLAVPTPRSRQVYDALSPFAGGASGAREP